MSKSLFRPQIDGLNFGKVSRINKKESDEIRKNIDSAIDATLNFLKSSYSGALEVYGVRKHLTDWVAKEIPSDYILHNGLIFLALDYFYSRCFIPKIDFANKKCPTKTQSFLRKRAEDHIYANLTLLLSSMAIIYLIPDRWLPESLIVDPVREQIRKVGGFRDSVIDLDLRISSGGYQWLNEKSSETWEKLKNCIGTGRPWPIRLIGSSLNPYENKSVIAYGYEDPGDGSGTIYVYDVNCPRQEHTIKLSFDGDTLSAMESCQSSHSNVLQGFFCENYSMVPPPFTNVSRFLHFILLMKIIWYMIRFLRLFWLWLK